MVKNVNMKCIAIDDEPLALNVMEDFIGKIPFLEFVRSCNSAFEAIEVLNSQKIDLVFLDINMPHLSGIDLLKSLEHQPLIIFTTAYSEFALDGYDMNATDYLLKPVAFSRFLKAVNKAFEIYLLRNKAKSIEKITDISDDLGQMMVKADYKTQKIFFGNIIYIEGLKDYVKIFTKVPNQSKSVKSLRPVITKSTLLHLEEKLPENFLRIHKSFIINLSNIEVVENNKVIVEDKIIPIGNKYRKEFYERLDSFKL